MKMNIFLITFLMVLTTSCNQYKFTPVEKFNNTLAEPIEEPVEPTPEPVEPTPEPPPVIVPPSPVTLTETFQIQAGKADILFVLDVSGSMSPDLKKIGEKFKSLTSKLDNIDWQIGITNADVGSGFFTHRFAMNGQLMTYQSDGKNFYVLNKSEKNGEQYFLRTISHDGFDVANDWASQNGISSGSPCFFQPYCQVSDPVPLKAIIKSMENKNSVANSSFFRKNALLVPVIISDADESEDAKDKKTTKPADVLNAYQQHLSGKMDGIMGFSMIIKPGDKACLENQKNLFKGGWFGKYGHTLDLFAQMTNGESISLCQKDFATPLAQISQKIHDRIDQVELSSEPIPESIQITTLPSLNLSWKLSGKKIIFNSIIPGGTRVSVSYLPK